MIIPAFIGMPGPWELGIVLLLVMMLFGVGKLPKVMAEMGKGIKMLRDAQRDEPIDVSRD